MANNLTFGHIQGFPPSSNFQTRAELSKARVHRHTQAGISGSQDIGADSIVLSGGYEDDKDNGKIIIYTGHGGRDPNSGLQIADQELHRGNLALVKSMEKGLPVRVIRGSRLESPFAPDTGYRYDGLYSVVDYWREEGQSGYFVWRYRLEVIQGEAVDFSDGVSIQDVDPERAETTISKTVRDTQPVKKIIKPNDFLIFARINQFFLNLLQIFNIQIRNKKTETTKAPVDGIPSLTDSGEEIVNESIDQLGINEPGASIKQGVVEEIPDQSEILEENGIISETDNLQNEINEYRDDVLVGDESQDGVIAEFVDDLDDKDFIDDMVEDENNIDSENTSIEIHQEEYEYEVDSLEEISELVQEVKAIPTKKRKKKFYFDYRDIPSLLDEEISRLLDVVHHGDLEREFELDLDRLEVLLLNVFSLYEFIGEFPLSKENFEVLCDLLRHKFGNKPINRIPPGLFVLSMVFCARYSEEEARKFWSPYSAIVWNKAPSQYLQERSRDHFIDARQFLGEKVGLDFPIQSHGGVVRPVYYHAIIPYYLQSSFADWIVDKFEEILLFSVDELPDILREEAGLRYAPVQLRNFVQGIDTAGAAINLIQQMARAIKLFQETELYETVSSLMDSPIERNLWKDIYEELIERKLSISTIRKITPKLNWIYNKFDERINLHLSNVRSSANIRPNLIVWADQRTTFLKSQEHITRISPWKFADGGWTVDPTHLGSDGDINGTVYVLSENFELEEQLESQDEEIIFNGKIPKFEDDVVQFYLSTQRKDARLKDNIEFDGNWILFGREGFDLLDLEGNIIVFQEAFVPPVLRENGFKLGRKYKLELPIKKISNQGTEIYRKSERANIIRADILGNEHIAGLSDDVQPIYQSRDHSILPTI